MKQDRRGFLQGIFGTSLLGMGWVRKNKKEPIPVTTLEERSAQDLLKAKLAELDPGKKYLFIWEQTLNPTHLQVISRELEKHLEGKKVMLLSGLKVPEIYEL